MIRFVKIQKGSVVEKRKNRRWAFTLLELIIVMLMLVVLTGSATYAYLITLKAFSGSFARQDIRQELDQAMVRMSREMRQARNITVNGAQIDFFADIEPTISGDERYQYIVSGSDLVLQRKSPGPAVIGVIARNLEAQQTFFSIANKLLTVQMQAQKNQQRILLRTSIRSRRM